MLGQHVPRSMPDVWVDRRGAPFRAEEDGEVGIVGSLHHTSKNLELERG